MERLPDQFVSRHSSRTWDGRLVTNVFVCLRFLHLAVIMSGEWSGYNDACILFVVMCVPESC